MYVVGYIAGKVGMLCGHSCLSVSCFFFYKMFERIEFRNVYVFHHMNQPQWLFCDEHICLSICHTHIPSSDVCTGKRKLGIEAEKVGLYLEEDGTAVDDDDVLMEFRDKDKVFLILPDSQMWSPPKVATGSDVATGRDVTTGSALPLAVDDSSICQTGVATPNNDGN